MLHQGKRTQNLFSSKFFSHDSLRVSRIKPSPDKSREKQTASRLHVYCKWTPAIAWRGCPLTGFNTLRADSPSIFLEDRRRLCLQGRGSTVELCKRKSSRNFGQSAESSVKGTYLGNNIKSRVCSQTKICTRDIVTDCSGNYNHRNAEGGELITGFSKL